MRISASTCSVCMFFKIPTSQGTLRWSQSMAAPWFTSIRLMTNSLLAPAPPTVSDAPLMNLVKEWITMSAPISIGEKIIGVNVLSTTSVRLCSLASLDISRISALPRRGCSELRSTAPWCFLGLLTNRIQIVGVYKLVVTLYRGEMLHEGICATINGARTDNVVTAPHGCINTADMAPMPVRYLCKSVFSSDAGPSTMQMGWCLE